MKIYFVRHGESKSNANKIHAGNEIDEGLTDVGISQAIKTGKYLATLCPHVDYIYSSPMKRAKETAEIIKNEMKLNIDIVYKKQLVEKSAGILAGLTHEQADALLKTSEFEEYNNLKTKFNALDIINRDLYFHQTNEILSKFLHSESYNDVGKRGKKIIRKIAKHKNINSNIIIVAHGALISDTVTKMLHVRSLNWANMLKSTFNCYLLIMEYNNKYFSLLTSPTNFFLESNEEQNSNYSKKIE